MVWTGVESKAGTNAANRERLRDMESFGVFQDLDAGEVVSLPRRESTSRLPELDLSLDAFPEAGHGRLVAAPTLHVAAGKLQTRGAIQDGHQVRAEVRQVRRLGRRLSWTPDLD